MKYRNLVAYLVAPAAIALIAPAVGGCKQRRDDGQSQTNDLQPGQLAQSGDITKLLNDMKKSPDPMGPNRKVVLIYYVNDTYAPRRDDPAQQNLDALVNFLNGTAQNEEDPAAKSRLTTMSAKLVTDWDKFRDVAARDTDALRRRLCAEVSPKLYNTVAGLAVFRNNWNDSSMFGSDMDYSREVRSLKWMSCTPGTAMTENYLEVPRATVSAFPYLSQPFSHPFVFRKALEAARSKFDPAKHRFVLITKSHGSTEMAISPHLSLDLTKDLQDPVKSQAIADALKQGGVATRDATGLNEVKATNPILAEVDSALTSTRPVDQTPGVSKSYYVDTLVALGNGDPTKAMTFPIVLLESCKSDLRTSTMLAEYIGSSTTGYDGLSMSNVGLIYASDERGLPYDYIDYRELMSPDYRNETDAQDMIKKFLDIKAKSKAP